MSVWPRYLGIEFFSFGTNDLTQTAPGMSRDDSGSFLPGYAELEIVKKNSLRMTTVRLAWPEQRRLFRRPWWQ
jgi:phosphoenolpyruvate synthase/pyruvate phosphate dikinase